MSESPIEPLALGPGEGLAVRNPVGGILTFKLTADQSGGALTAIDTVAAPGEGPPLHIHRDEDEIVYTVDGTLRLKLADEVIQAPAGSFAFIPRGTPHTWQNVGDAPARFFVAVMPAATAFERFFLTYARFPPHERGAEAFARPAKDTQALEVVGPPLAQSDPI
jgi:quercetin dioxygenase-like cupin family protein